MIDWNDLAARALTLQERIAAAATPTVDSRPAGREDDVERRFAAWRERAAAGDDRAFERRLRWAGLDEKSARALLGRPVWPAGQPLPAWVLALSPAVEAGGRGPESGADGEAAGLVTPARRYVDAGAPLPFEEVWCPLVDAAARRLDAAFRGASHIAGDNLAATFERQLLSQLCSLAGQVLLVEFGVAKTFSRGGPLSSLSWFGSLPGTPQRTLYDAFVRGLLEDGCSALFDTYPVLARLLGTAILSWERAASRFLADLVGDYARLEAHFGTRGLLGRLANVVLSLSDRHDGGRTVVRAEFENGVRLLYKPRNIEGEAHYYGLLRWCNDRGLSLPFAIFDTLPCGDHGWVAEVRPAPCQTEAEAQRYFRRAGMLLCLAYVFEGADAHQENIVAHGEWPVLIDMETLFHPRVRPIEETPAVGPARSAAEQYFFWDSVFRTAFLPRWEVGPNGESYDISGLGGIESHATHLRLPRWENVNTDAMDVRWEVLETAGRNNIVRVGDRVVRPAGHVGEIVAGFDEMYRFLDRNRDPLQEPGGVLDRLAACRMRALFRDTKLYGGVLTQMVKTASLHDGADAAIQLEALFRPFLHGDRPPVLYSLVEDEVAALMALDVPAFYFDPLTTHVTLRSGDELRDVFVEPSVDKVRRNLACLSAEDRERQCQYIRSSFIAAPGVTPESGVRGPESGVRGPGSGVERPGSGVQSPESGVRSQESGGAGPKSGLDLLAAARDIGEAIADCAIVSADTATWLSVGYLAEAERWQLQPMTFRLYDGASGTALFLAALARATGEERFRKLAIAAVRLMPRELDTRLGRAALLEPGIGAGIGATSVVYALGQMAGWLQCDDMLATATRVADLVDEHTIEADARFDLMAGAGGALLSFLFLERVTGERRFLERAIACGERLRACQHPAGKQGAAWATQGAVLTGYSHGAAGIACALLRLATRTGDTRWRDAALDAIRYENSLYDAEQNNWPDLRRADGDRRREFRDSWCHGAAGIGLGRAATLEEDADGSLREDVHRAAARCMADLASWDAIDHVCCGNFGRAEALLEMGLRLGVSAWADRARQFVFELVAARRAARGFSLGWGDGPYIPSFHQGMAGIGYTLLRFAAPDRWPCVLLWE